MQSLKISAKQPLENIAAEFNRHFPYLQLKFFEEKHGVGEESDQWDTLNAHLTLEQVGDAAADTEMSMDGHLKVSTFEQRFQDTFGIGVQVMRREGKGWRQTITSDEWTLSAQNREGKKNSQPA